MKTSSRAGQATIAQDRLAVLEKCQRDAPVDAAGDEIARAVDRIGDPHAPLGETRKIVGRFFRDPTIVGPRLDQRLVKQPVDGEVALAHRRAVGLVPIALARASSDSSADALALRTAARAISTSLAEIVDQLRRPQW